MKKKYIYIILVLLVVGYLSYRFTRSSRTEVAEVSASASTRPMQVNAIVVEPQDFSNIITLSGSIEPNEQVQIRSEVSGIIRRLAFREGSDVSKGQLLLQIDDTELQAQLMQANTYEKLAEENAERARLLLEKEAISKQEYDVAQADFESTRAQSALIRAQLAKTSVRAPFSGKIGLRSVSEGEYLTPATPVANLVSTNPVKLQFSVPEKYAAQVREKQALQFTISGLNTSFAAEIYAIEPGVDASTRTINIRAIAQNVDGLLVPGAFARIELALDKIEAAILVPSESIIPVQSGKEIYVFRNGKALRIPVEAENRTSRDVLITQGLNIGDTVITSGIMTLRNEMPVTVTVNINQNNETTP